MGSKRSIATFYTTQKPIINNNTFRLCKRVGGSVALRLCKKQVKDKQSFHINPLLMRDKLMNTLYRMTVHCPLSTEHWPVTTISKLLSDQLISYRTHVWANTPGTLVSWSLNWIRLAVSAPVFTCCVSAVYLPGAGLVLSPSKKLTPV